MSKYVFVPFTFVPAQFDRDIKKMGAHAVTLKKGTHSEKGTLSELVSGQDELSIMGHCGPGLHALYTAATGKCAEIDAKAIVEAMGNRGLPTNWTNITLIACCAAADKAKEVNRTKSFASELEYWFPQYGYRQVKVNASMHSVIVMERKPVEIGTIEGHVIAADYANRRAPLVRLPQSAAGPSASGPSSSGSGARRPAGGSGSR